MTRTNRDMVSNFFGHPPLDVLPCRALLLRLHSTASQFLFPVSLQYLLMLPCICRLPGTPLGNTGLSWSDVLLGNLPNVYIYAGVRCLSTLEHCQPPDNHQCRTSVHVCHRQGHGVL